MTDKKHPISKALGIASGDVDNESVEVAVVNPTPIQTNDTVKDFEFVRENTYSLLHDSMKAVEELVQIASYSQDHESYASLALLMKTAAQLNRDLISFNFKKDVLSQGNPTGGPTNITSHNTIVMTTAEAMAMLEKKK